MNSLDWFGTQVDRSSLGYHMIAPYLYGDVEAPIIAAKPAVMKVVADGGEFSMFGNYYNSLKDKSIFIARAFTPGELVNQGISYGVPVETIAQDWRNAILPLVPYLPKAYWEVCNEPASAFTPVLAQVVARCIELAAASGFRVAAPSWSTGYPGMARWGDEDSWDDFFPALQAIHNYGPGVAILAVHEYADHPGNFLDSPWAVSRINGVYEDYIEPNGWNIWTVVTEYGRDTPAWQDIPINIEQYSNELADDAVQNLYHPRVIGRTIYTLNHTAWPKFNIWSCFNTVNNYIANRQPATYPPIPGPGPTPPPPPLPPSDEIWVVKVVSTVNQRSGPSANHTWLGKIGVSTPPTILKVHSNLVNGYHEVVGQGWWVYSNDGRNLVRIG